MQVFTYSQVRKNFTKTMSKVCEDHTSIIITRQNKKPVVMMSLEDYNALEETLYLLRSPNNASRIVNALEDIKKDLLLKQNLIE